MNKPNTIKKMIQGAACCALTLGTPLLNPAIAGDGYNNAAFTFICAEERNGRCVKTIQCLWVDGKLIYCG
ncbi:MAG: hypothetical protein AAF329_18595 [Cyanobacteria bacterium P01_A01_bin.17]